MGGLGAEPEAFMVLSDMKSRDGGCGEEQRWGNHLGVLQRPLIPEASRALHLYSSPSSVQCQGGELRRAGVQPSGKENDSVNLGAQCS